MDILGNEDTCTTLKDGISCDVIELSMTYFFKIILFSMQFDYFDFCDNN